MLAPQLRQRFWGCGGRLLVGRASAPLASRLRCCVKRVAGISQREALEVVVQSVRATQSATGATSSAHVEDVYVSCFAKPPINRQLPSRFSKNRSRLSSVFATQSNT